jgi:hypothetical protein
MSAHRGLSAPMSITPAAITIIFTIQDDSPRLIAYTAALLAADRRELTWWHWERGSRWETQTRRAIADM